MYTSVDFITGSSTLNSFMGKTDPWEVFPKSSQAFARQPLKSCRFCVVLEKVQGREAQVEID